MLNFDVFFLFFYFFFVYSEVTPARPSVPSETSNAPQKKKSEDDQERTILEGTEERRPKRTMSPVRIKSVVLDTNYFHEYEMGYYFSLKFTNNCSWTEIILFVHKFEEKKN